MPKYMTYNQILRDQTRDYLATINPARVPSPDEIESEILHKVASYIDAANAGPNDSNLNFSDVTAIAVKKISNGRG